MLKELGGKSLDSLGRRPNQTGEYMKNGSTFLKRSLLGAALMIMSSSLASATLADCLSAHTLADLIADNSVGWLSASRQDLFEFRLQLDRCVACHREP
jgi:hypothetical protein